MLLNPVQDFLSLSPEKKHHNSVYLIESIMFLLKQKIFSILKFFFNLKTPHFR